MAKKRQHRRKSYGRKRGFIRRHIKGKVPLEMLIGAGTIPFTEPNTGWGSFPVKAIQNGDWTGLMDQLKAGFIGMAPSGQIDVFNLLNPFNLESGRYTKILFWSGIAGKIRKRMVPQSSMLIKKIPLVGRWVS